MYIITLLKRIFLQFIFSSLNETMGGGGSEYEQSKSQLKEKEEISQQNLTPEQKEIYTKIEEIQKKLESIGATEKITGTASDRLLKGLTSDSSIKDDPEAKETIRLFEKYKIEFVKAKEEKKITEEELHTYQSMLSELGDKFEYNSGIDEKGVKLDFDNEKLKTITSKEFLSIGEEKRLQYVTKGNIDADSVSSGNIKDIEFTFNQDVNKEFYMLTTAGQVLPKEVRQVTSDGQTYIRNGLRGEFYNGAKRFTIHDGTRIQVDKLGTPDELTNIEKMGQEKVAEFLKKYSDYDNEKYTSTLNEAFSKGIENEGDILYLLSGDPKNLEKSSPDDLNKLLVVSTYLKNGGFLDDYTHAGELVNVLKEIIETLDKYGKGLKYTVGNGGNINFKFDNNGLPEGLGVEPSLEKFTKIALSQLGTTEFGGGADKYLSGIGHGNLNSRNTPWCAAFVNWSLKQAGFKGTGGLSAKEFIGDTGYGHVGIKLGDKLLGGNQGNKVSLMNIKKPIAGYAIPSEKGLEIHKPAGNIDKIPDGAILVFDRNVKKDRNFA